MEMRHLKTVAHVAGLAGIASVTSGIFIGNG